MPDEPASARSTRLWREVRGAAAATEILRMRVRTGDDFAVASARLSDAAEEQD